MATTTCVDCHTEVSSDDVRYVNGRQVCATCADAAGAVSGASTGAMGHWWTRIVVAATVAAIVAAVGCPLAIHAIGVSSWLVVAAGGALVGFAVRLATKNDAGFSERAVAVAFALLAAIVGDFLLFGLSSAGGLASANPAGWLDAVVSFGGVGAFMRFGIGPIAAFALSGSND